MLELGDAIALAVFAHRDQVDKQGQPYIRHLVRVMQSIIVQFPDNQEIQIVAVLHDLIEDTHYEAQDLVDFGYSAEIVEAINALSRRRGESYDFYIECVGRNEMARLVKLADLRDHLRNVDSLPEKDIDRLKPRHLKALEYLYDLGGGNK